MKQFSVRVSKDLAVVHHSCMSKASAYETAITYRAEELKVLATANNNNG